MFGHLALLEAFVDPSDVLPERRIVVVLDAVIRSINSCNETNLRHLPSLEQFGDVGPFVAVNLVSVKNYYFFLVIDWRFLDIRVQVVVPSLSTLLARPAPYLVVFLEHLGDEGPPLGAVLGDKAYDGIIFLYNLDEYFKFKSG